MEHDELLSTSKIQLVCKKDSIFIATVLFSLKQSWDATIPTACTDGVRLIISPKYFTALSAKARLSLLAHETYHVVFMHMDRVGRRNFRLWNIACDYYINLMLKDAGFEIPNNWLLDEQYRDMSAYEIYDALEKDPNNQPKDFDEDFKQIPEADREEIVTEIEGAIIRATMQAEAANQGGSVPAEIKRYVNKLLNPKLPWYKILANDLHSRAKDDYSYSRFNRRFMPQFYLPTLYSESLGKITNVVDVSASVTQEDLTEFITESRAIYAQLKPEKMTISAFDTQITCEEDINNINDWAAFDFGGGGGTNINAVMDYARKTKPEILIIFTDGEFWYPPDFTGITAKIYWIIKGNPSFTANQGKIIHFEER